MDYNLKGKIVGVTGAASPNGIGYAIARRFLQEGCKCFIVDIVGDKVALAAEALSEFGEVKAYTADVSDKDQMIKVYEDAAAAFGKIDIYVNNAGVGHTAPLAELDEEDWDRELRVDVKSVFLSAKYLPKYMNRGGTIINAASFVTLIPSAVMGAYSAAKAAVMALTRVMAAELSGMDIRVNAYIPGIIDTNMNRQRIETIGDKLQAQIATQRFGMPDDVAKGVVFLASEAASYINGTYLEVSGGKFCVQNPNYAHV